MWCSLDACKLFRYNRLLRPSGGMADAAVSKTVVERRASSTLASGTSFLDFARRPLGRLFRSPPKKADPPKESALSLKYRRPEKPSCGCTSCNGCRRQLREKTKQPAGTRPIGGLEHRGSTRKKTRRASSCGARLFAKRTISYRATRQKAPSASSQWRRSSSRP